MGSKEIKELEKKLIYEFGGQWSLIWPDIINFIFKAGYRKIPSKESMQKIIYDAYFPCRGGVEKSKKAAKEIYKLLDIE